VHQQTGTEVVEDRDAAASAELRELAQRHLTREPADAEVGPVHLEEYTGLGGEGSLVVAPVRAVGGAHLDEPCAAPLHDLRDAERVADLHEFAAAHHRVTPE